MNRFSIVEFEDGLQLVPSNWLKGTSECFWPTHGNINKLHKNITQCEEPDDTNWEIVKVIRIFGTANSYESGVAKVKRAEQFSDIESSDVDSTSKKRRHIRAKKCTNFDEDYDDWQHTLPPPPKKPVSNTLSTMNSITNKTMEDSSLSENSAKEKQSNGSILPFMENISQKRMEHSLPSENSTKRKHSNDNIVQSMHNILKRHPTEASVSTDNNSSIFVADIEFKKELLRRCNKIEAKLDRVDGRLNNLEERLQSGINNKNQEYFDMEEIVSFPLQTKEALHQLELDLQDADFFKNFNNFIKHLGGKTYHEMTVLILKYIISNFLSTLYCWNGKDGKKEAFKDLLLAKCIKQSIKSKFESANDQQITQVISKWFLQGKLRCDREKERLQRKQQKLQD